MAIKRCCGVGGDGTYHNAGYVDVKTLFPRGGPQIVVELIENLNL